MHDQIAERGGPQPASNAEQVDEEVFKNVFIPRTLSEVKNYERDISVNGVTHLTVSIQKAKTLIQLNSYIKLLLELNRIYQDHNRHRVI